MSVLVLIIQALTGCKFRPEWRNRNTQPLFVGSVSGSVCTMNRSTSDGHILRFEKNGYEVGAISTNGNSLPSDRNF